MTYAAEAVGVRRIVAAVDSSGTHAPSSRTAGMEDQEVLRGVRPTEVLGTPRPYDKLAAAAIAPRRRWAARCEDQRRVPAEP